MFALTATTAFALFASLAAAAPSNGIWNLPSAKATVYYDLTNSMCGNNNPFADNWAETSGINRGIPSCESWAGASAKSLAQLGTNRIVAMDVNKISGNLAEWCGKEVVIFDANGKKFEFSEGPLYIWDSCAAAASESIVDVSAKAFTELKGGSCGGNNPTGLTVSVLNNNIVAPWLSGGGRGSTGSTGGSAPGGAPVKLNAEIPSDSAAKLASPTTSADAAPKSPVPAKPSPPAATAEKAASTPKAAADKPKTTAASPAKAAPSPAADDDTDSAPPAPAAAAPASAAPGGSTGSCTFGAWQCNGKSIEVCSYVSITDLDWVSTGTCANECSVSGSSVVCA